MDPLSGWVFTFYKDGKESTGGPKQAAVVSERVAVEVLSAVEWDATVGVKGGPTPGRDDKWARRNQSAGSWWTARHGPIACRALLTSRRTINTSPEQSAQPWTRASVAAPTDATASDWVQCLWQRNPRRLVREPSVNLFVSDNVTEPCQRPTSSPRLDPWCLQQCAPMCGLGFRTRNSPSQKTSLRWGDCCPLANAHPLNYTALYDK